MLETIVHKSKPLKKFCSREFIADVQSKIQAYLYEEVSRKLNKPQWLLRINPAHPHCNLKKTKIKGSVDVNS